MIKIFSSNINGLVLINGCSVINNYLTISGYLANIRHVNDDNMFDISKILIVIDMNKRIIIIYDKLDINLLTIVDDNIYCIIDGNIDIYNFDIVTVPDNARRCVLLNKIGHSQKIVADTFQDVIISIDELVDNKIYKLNNEIYYCVYNNLAQEKICSRFIFRKLKDNSKYLTVKLSCDHTSVEKSEYNFVINLPFESCHTLSHNDTLIFYDDYSTYIKVNLNTGEFKSMNIERIYNDTKIHSHICNIHISSAYISSTQIIGDYEVLCQYGDISHVTDVDNRTKIIYNFIDDTFEILKFYKHIVVMKLFTYNGRKHYIIVDRSFEFNIFVKEGDYIKSICDVMKDDFIITIGTENEKVGMSFNLLMMKSYFINSLFNDLKGNIKSELISDNFKNITLYKDFIENNKYDTDSLYDLYVIANYMQDCNINYLAEIIISHVNQNDIDIDKSFKYLESLRTSTCDEQFLVLIYTIFKKYDNSLFLNMISDENLLLNNYIRKVLKFELNNLFLEKTENIIDQNNNNDNLFKALNSALKISI